MASLETTARQSRDALPSIHNFDFEKYRVEKADYSRYSHSNVNSITKHTMSSPPSTTYSGPPPPYSSIASIPAQTVSGYISPPESNSRRSTRDEKDSPKAAMLLPSISEALKSSDVPSTAPTYTPTPVPGSTVGQMFGDAPKGPGNPFSQPSVPASALRSTISSMLEQPSIKAVPPPPTPPDKRPPPLISTLGSPRSSQRPSGPPASVAAQLDPPFRSSFSADSSRPGYPFPDYHTQQPSQTPHTSSTFHFESKAKIDETRNPFVKPDPTPYNETIKRHLDVYDAELALSEIIDASAHTLEFAKGWGQRYHQANRASYLTDGLPGSAEVDEMLKLSAHIQENLTRLREVALMQEKALDEQRARAMQGQHLEDEYHSLTDDYKAGGFAAGDAKKRRGKAAPPGRCHSCNRAETPEWRRGPDGARTLCNACGLHYAKLTRKMGANKASVLSGSNLRPKNLTDARP